MDNNIFNTNAEETLNDLFEERDKKEQELNNLEAEQIEAKENIKVKDDNKSIKQTQNEPEDMLKKDKSCGCGNPDCGCGENCSCGDDCKCGEDCDCEQDENAQNDKNLEENGNKTKTNNNNHKNDNECHCKHKDNEKADNTRENDNECQNLNEEETITEPSEMFNHLIKLQAEFDNFRKRTEADVSKAYKNGFTDAVTDFLPALDSFKMAKDMITDKNTLIGIQYIEKGILNTLEKMGVSAIDATGKFDPHFHQAIDTDTTADVESGFIVKECYKGFIMGDKVIRYSQVIVKK